MYVVEYRNMLNEWTPDLRPFTREQAIAQAQKTRRLTLPYHSPELHRQLRVRVRRVARHVCRDRNCGPICDHCQWYRFHGNESGAYMGRGECVHPKHPHPEDPSGGCEDYACAFWADADPEQAAAHHASQREPSS